MIGEPLSGARSFPRDRIWSGSLFLLGWSLWPGRLRGVGGALLSDRTLRCPGGSALVQSGYSRGLHGANSPRTGARSCCWERPARRATLSIHGWKCGWMVSRATRAFSQLRAAWWPRLGRRMLASPLLPLQSRYFRNSRTKSEHDRPFSPTYRGQNFEPGCGQRSLEVGDQHEPLSGCCGPESQ